MATMAVENARDNIQNVLDQLRMTKPERDTLDSSLRLLYSRAVDGEELEKELEDAGKQSAA
jgi:hypothetical protein